MLAGTKKALERARLKRSSGLSTFADESDDYCFSLISPQIVVDAPFGSAARIVFRRMRKLLHRKANLITACWPNQDSVQINSS